ncbi:MAG: AzlD domain-containing protein [Desulfobulbaceae bacterium]|uniref:AzlD domain-containing protein n=1 Tax=Candidatus Desulfatifera sulfidica TaxID=2841691 RepID=A0A8J6NAM4_9BACT|nr:AzlD domain-containing protein [Candidatus Desulfatifera sulfidica]
MMPDLIQQQDVWLTIFAAAMVTYGLRLGGLLLAERLPRTGRFQRFMNALPGTILLSLIIPSALAAGFWGWVATLFTAACSLKTGNVFVSMLLGMAIVAGGRLLG